MPRDRFANATIPELIALKESVQRRITMGQITMTTYAGDQQMRSFTGAPKCSVVLNWIDYSLWLKDPESYTNPYSARSRRTVSDFST